MNQPSAPRIRYRFGLGHLLVLVLGICIGFAPLKLWELRAPAGTQILVQLQVLDIDNNEAEQLRAIPRFKKDKTSIAETRNELFSRIKSLKEQNKIRVLASPSILTLNGQSTSFTSGGELPYPKLSEDDRMTIEYREFGTHIDMEPKLLRNGRIRLSLSPTIIEVDHSQAIDVGELSVPALRTRSMDTEVEVSDGETIVLSGLSNASMDDSTSQTLVVATVERVPQR